MQYSRTSYRGRAPIADKHAHTISPLTSCWEAAPSASKPARRRFAALIAPLLEAPGNAKSMREIRQLGSAPKRSMTKCCTMYLDVSSFPHSTWIRWHTGHQATCAPLERNCSSTFKHVVTVVCTGAEHGSDRTTQDESRCVCMCINYISHDRQPWQHWTPARFVPAHTPIKDCSGTHRAPAFNLNGRRQQGDHEPGQATGLRATYESKLEGLLLSFQHSRFGKETCFSVREDFLKGSG